MIKAGDFVKVYSLALEEDVFYEVIGVEGDEIYDKHHFYTKNGMMLKATVGGSIGEEEGWYWISIRAVEEVQ